MSVGQAPRGSLCRMSHVTSALPQYIPSPPISSFHVGPLDIRFYALGYIIGITLAILITRRRWRTVGGDPDLVNNIALWVVPGGIIGGRIYFDITTPTDIPHVWYGVLAVWTGGLGIWGGVALAAAVGVWRLRRLGITPGAFANAIAPALLVAQAIGRIGNYFNKELFGGPTTLPWGLEIPYAYRVTGGIPAQDLHFATFQPTFLYELIWTWRSPPSWPGSATAPRSGRGLFALYVAGDSAFRTSRNRCGSTPPSISSTAAEHVHRDRPDTGRARLVRRRAAPTVPPCRGLRLLRCPGRRARRPGRRPGRRGGARAGHHRPFRRMTARPVGLGARPPRHRAG